MQLTGKIWLNNRLVLRSLGLAPPPGYPRSAVDFLLNINESTQKLLFQKGFVSSSNHCIKTHDQIYLLKPTNNCWEEPNTQIIYVLINTALCTQVSLDPTSVPVYQYISPGRFKCLELAALVGDLAVGLNDV